MLDKFSSEYGWTTKQVLHLTMKEVSWRLEAINERTMEEFETRAALHGHKVKKRVRKRPKKAKEVVLDEANELAIQEAFKSRMKEHGQ